MKKKIDVPNHQLLTSVEIKQIRLIMSQTIGTVSHKPYQNHNGPPMINLGPQPRKMWGKQRRSTILEILHYTALICIIFFLAESYRFFLWDFLKKANQRNIRSRLPQWLANQLHVV